jgi:hypothetical protein
MQKAKRITIIGLLFFFGVVSLSLSVDEFSSEVRNVLEQRVAVLKKDLAENPIVTRETRISNEKNKNLSLSEIKRLDEQWMTAKGMDEFSKGFMNNECAQQLVQFQEAHRGYPEIFVSDAYGLIVGSTNKTSDYYQADEEWWVKGLAEGQGYTFYGEIEYDESAMAESIPVYVPVMDPDTKEAIGVIKAIVDITAIKMEL